MLSIFNVKVFLLLRGNRPNKKLLGVGLCMLALRRASNLSRVHGTSRKIITYLKLKITAVGAGKSSFLLVHWCKDCQAMKADMEPWVSSEG